MAAGKTIWTWHQGSWHQGNHLILGAADHATWLGTMIFDGARAFEGVAPDLDRHCQRANNSARTMGLKPLHSGDEMLEIAREGIAKYSSDTALYIRPMYWSRGHSGSMVLADPETTDFALCIEDIPMPEPTGSSITTTRFRRPTIDCMPTDAKAGCLYPNNARMLRDVRARGFKNAIVLDALGNVAETATSNIWMVRDGVALTPTPNGTFLNGITRQRVLNLLAEAGIPAHQTTLTLEDFRAADEIFTTGNAGKVLPVTRFDDREFEFGPIARRARELYWEFAHAG